MVQYIKS